MKIKEAFVQKFQIPSIQLKFQWRLANVTIYPRLHSEYLDTPRAWLRIVRQSLCSKLSTPRNSFCVRNLWKLKWQQPLIFKLQESFQKANLSRLCLWTRDPEPILFLRRRPAWLLHHEGWKHHECVKFMSQRPLFSCDHRKPPRARPSLQPRRIRLIPPT